MHFSFPTRIFAVLLLANLVAASSKSSSSKKLESQDLSTSPPQSPKNKNKNKSKKSHSHITHRMTLEARTTLLGVEMEDLTATETIFFEDTWMTAYAQVHTNDDEIRAFVVHDDHPQDRGRQLLRGWSSPASAPESRSLFFRWWKPKTQYYYFDIFALFEISCGISCGDDRRKLLEDQAEMEEEFKTVLCDLLRTGTMACFQDIDDCQVTYFEV
jgi:hypothetical protein